MLGTRQNMCLAVLQTSNVILSFKYERHENALICDLYGFYVSCRDNCASHFTAGAHCALQPGVNISLRTYPNGRYLCRMSVIQQETQHKRRYHKFNHPELRVLFRLGQLKTDKCDRAEVLFGCVIWSLGAGLLLLLCGAC